MSSILAGLAIVVSIIALALQYTQARGSASRTDELQQRMVELEEARRKDEQRPVLTLRYHGGLDDNDEVFEWINDGPADLDDVQFSVIRRGGVGWQPLRGVRFRTEGQTVEDGSLGPMRIGEPVAHGIVRTPGSERDGGTARFRMTCRVEDLVWEFSLFCELPPAAHSQ